MYQCIHRDTFIRVKSSLLYTIATLHCICAEVVRFYSHAQIQRPVRGIVFLTPFNLFRYLINIKYPLRVVCDNDIFTLNNLV